MSEGLGAERVGLAALRTRASVVGHDRHLYLACRYDAIASTLPVDAPLRPVHRRTAEFLPYPHRGDRP